MKTKWSKEAQIEDETGSRQTYLLILTAFNPGYLIPCV